MRRKRRIIHKITFVLVFLALLSLSGTCIYYGLYFAKLADSRNIILSNVNILKKFSKNYALLNLKYDVGDNFSIDGVVKYNLSSELYYKNAFSDAESLKKFNYLKNLSNMNTTFSYKQDKTTKKVYCDTTNKIGNEDIYSMKFYSENSTKYYKVDGVVTDFVNRGNFNYFENYGEGITTKDNFKYLYDYLFTALAYSIPENEIEAVDVTEMIDGEYRDLHRVSVKFTNIVIRETLNNFFNELRKDERANSIISNVYGDFSKFEVDDEKFYLDSDESYTFNIYTDRLFFNPRKYELIHIHGNDRTTYYIELHDDVNKMYVVEGDKAVYSADVTFNNDSIDAVIFDSKANDIGSLKLSNDNTGIDFNYSFDNGKDKREIIYSSKYDNVNNKHSYTNNKKLDLKIIDDNVSRVSGSIEANINVSDDVSIMEDVSNSVLYSTLSDEVKEKLDNSRERIKLRMEK